MLEFNLFKPYSNRMMAGVTSKNMGSFKETDHYFQKNINALTLGQPALGHQTHSDMILEVTEPFNRDDLPEGDALITTKKDLLLMVKTADCQGLIIYDPLQEVLGVVHSGWKGSVKNIIGKTLQKMKNLYHSDPKDLKIAIGPSLGPCCSEFSNPKIELPEFCHPFILPNNHVDFWDLSKKQCMDEGVLESNLEIAKICTKDDPHYFSYRLGDEGRMGVWAKLI